MTHAILAPSGSWRWFNCPGSMALCKDIPPQPPSIDAASGTLTHMIAESILTGQAVDADWPGQRVEVDGFTFDVDAERVERAMVYVNAVRRINMHEACVYNAVESRLSLGPVYGITGQFGTADHIAVLEISDKGFGDQRILYVSDLKDGQNRVDAGTLEKPNLQLLSYGLAALYEVELLLGPVTSIHMEIHQPRIDHGSGLALTRADAVAWIPKLQRAAGKAYEMWSGLVTAGQIKGALNPGDWCRWCPAAGSCPARSDQIGAMFNDVTQAGEPLRMTEDQLAWWLQNERTILDALSKFRAEATARARLGTAIPGFKLATGRQGPRKWANPQLAESVLNKKLAGDAYTRELISPTAAEKKLKADPETWQALQSSITRSEGQLSLVPEADPRNAVVAGAAEFDDVTCDLLS